LPASLACMADAPVPPGDAWLMHDDSAPMRAVLSTMHTHRDQRAWLITGSHPASAGRGRDSLSLAGIAGAGRPGEPASAVHPRSGRRRLGGAGRQVVCFHPAPASGLGCVAEHPLLVVERGAGFGAALGAGDAELPVLVEVADGELLRTAAQRCAAAEVQHFVRLAVVCR